MSATIAENYPDLDELRHEMSEITRDPQLSRVLKNKSVMIVGPAETMLGTRQGTSVDLHDVVVRFNTAIQYMPFSAELAADIGTRTDILYCNNEVLTERILHQKGISHEKFTEVCRSAEIKYLISTNNDFLFPAAGDPEPGCLSEYRDFEQFLQQQRIDIEFRMLYSTSAVARKLLRGYIGRTGFLAILDLLSYEIRELNIAGMTFYHKGGHLFLEDCVAELHPMKNHHGLEPPESIKGHNSYLEIELMRKLVVLYGARLKLDEQVQALLAARTTSE